jgi:HPt (histidine-containing phosphotransfer) domain-containing protein
MFVMTMKEQMEKLKASLDTGDAKQIRFYAHSIKGMTANISSPALYETAYQTEIAGEKGEIEKARSLTAEMECLFAAFLSLASDSEK